MSTRSPTTTSWGVTSVRLAPLFVRFRRAYGAGPAGAGRRCRDRRTDTRRIVGRGAEVVAVEPSPEFVARRRRATPRSRRTKAPAEEMPFADDILRHRPGPARRRVHGGRTRREIRKDGGGRATPWLGRSGACGGCMMAAMNMTAPPHGAATPIGAPSGDRGCGYQSGRAASTCSPDGRVRRTSRRCELDVTASNRYGEPSTSGECATEQAGGPGGGWLQSLQGEQRTRCARRGCTVGARRSGRARSS